jgi:acetyltransferase-like isoleucine patch superfamily enzyme
MFSFFKTLLLQYISYLNAKYKIFKLSKIHNTCKFHYTCKIESCQFGNYVVIFENTKISSAKIGAYSYIQTGGRIFNCEIGRFCSIASDVTIAPGIHDMSKVSTHPIFVQKSTPLPKVYATMDFLKNHKQVYIGNDVWIGEKVVILDGVTIGHGAIIAAGAIVTKDVEPYSVVGGVPAKHIKYRFDSETISIVKKSEWWNYSEEWFEKNSELMRNPTMFITYLKNGIQSY